MDRSPLSSIYSPQRQVETIPNISTFRARVFGPRGTSCALLIERAPDPETDDADPVAGCSTATISRADLVSKAGPGTAAEAMAAAIAGHPRRSIDRCTPVILV